MTYEPLVQLLDLLGLEPNQKTWTFIGRALAEFAGRQSAYSESYFSALWNGSREIPGAPLAKSITLMNAWLQFQEAFMQTHKLQVLPGLWIRWGSQVGESSKMCSVDGCQNVFLSNHPNRTKCFTCSPPRGKEHLVKALQRLEEERD